MSNCFVSVHNAVIERYARSLYQVAVSMKKVDDIASQIANMKKVLERIENLQKLLKRFSLISDLGVDFINKLKGDLKINNAVENLLLLLLKNKRLFLLPDICDAYERFACESANTVTFDIAYAKSFSSDDEAKLIDALQKQIDGNVVLKLNRDDSLLSGFQVRCKSKMLDFSFRSKLDRLSNSIRGI